MISVGEGTEEYLLTALQSTQNKAAKIICNRGKRYSATQALQDVGWMDVRTLVKYHSLVQTKKVLDTRQPLYLHETVNIRNSERKENSKQAKFRNRGNQGNLYIFENLCIGNEI